ncbi:MAG: hypothetical protein BWX44_00053 [Spirochaetes bacterium ADurb.Bin001]|nr:MAG: hypothetical protein BWX44_00053 [Spirochaetes bacterium ADurb.Bin001]
MAKREKKKSKFKGAVGRNAEKQNRGASYGHLKLPKGVNVFKEEPKTRVTFDIMPYVVTGDYHPDRDEEYGIAVKGELWYKRPYWLHRNIGSDNQSIVCPTSIGQKCPICEYRAQLIKDGAKWDDDSVRALKPSLRNLYVVIPKGNKNRPEEPHVWDISQFLFQERLNEEVQENEEYETFPDLEDGFTLKVRFTENSFGSNKFAETSRIDFLERKKPYNESILDEIPSLDDLLEVPSHSTLEAIFFGGLSADEVDEDDDDDDKEEKKPRRNQNRKQKDDDDDDREDEDEDKDEDSPEDEDEDDDDSGEDDDDKRPRRQQSRLPKEKESKKPSRKSEKSGGKGKGKCPHGHAFGEDCDEYDDCDDCDKWNDCMDYVPL